MRKHSYLSVTDQFCGAGGSSQGVRRLARRKKLGNGLQVAVALNHWKLAIETHNTNFPETFHDCTDIQACDPRRYPSTNILITSPECTNHSLAKGQKIVKAQMDLFASGKVDPAAERSRATMWDVPRFAEYHKYEIIVVENVVDARKWVMYDAWLMAMHAMGYKHKAIYHNSMHHHPTPQSRDRMYVVFWKKGNPEPDLNYTPTAFCHRCAKDIDAVQTWKDPLKKFGKYRQQYVYSCPLCTARVEPYYHAAMNIIDWSDIGIRIGDRKKELSPKTIERIEYGLKKYKDTVFYINDQKSGIIPPFIIKLEHGFNASSVGEEVNTQTTRHSQMLLNIRSTIDVLQTQTSTQGMGIVTAPPFITDSHRNGVMRLATDPLSTATAGGAKNGIVTTESWNAFLSYWYKTKQASHAIEAIGTQGTVDTCQLVTTPVPATVDDCYYRMLKPTEVKLAMAFDHDYVILGNAKQQVKQCGNAVTPPVMEWIIEKCVQSLS